MGRFLYFLPKVKGAGPDQLNALGLGELLADAHPEWGEVPAGPGEAAGCMCRIPDSRPYRFGYDADNQTWKVASNGMYWLGFENASRPGPEDLKLDEQIAGHAVTLGDGRDWLIPVGRLFLAERAPITKLHLNGDGGWVSGEAIDRLRGIEADAMRIWENFHLALVESEQTGRDAVLVMDATELAELAVRALRLNYRVGPDEIDMLELLDSRNVDAVARAVIDWPTIEGLIAYQKKTGALTAME